MNTTAIEWTDLTWNPTRGCSRVSPGCEHCYAERIAARFSKEDHQTKTRERKRGPFAGFARMTPNGPSWTGRVELVESELTEPLRRRRWAEKFLREHGRKPLVFVDSMSDLCHERLSDKAIHRVFHTMAEAVWFDFVVLTKRAGRLPAICGARPRGWVLPHVYLGVSVEDQQRADARLPHLMQVAAMGWKTVVSAEPLLSPLHLKGEWVKLGWLIIGGESGPNSRPCELACIRSLRDQATAAGVPCYIKQLGSRPIESDDGPRLAPYTHQERLKLRHPRGADPSEWPADLRIREEPRC